ncbi:hypothetical protein QBC42DRAFT_261423 [Cladorrhinum samala]|uniref:Uncharacterized protein n=1 Tax=Cladorrhinum samala TaxID=585594 RepID=A0AAV9I0H1_9PEZI|nr:hypothetical protein QBC42DRAFT_261423 [Cladorrhinum samala]
MMMYSSFKWQTTHQPKPIHFHLLLFFWLASLFPFLCKMKQKQKKKDNYSSLSLSLSFSCFSFFTPRRHSLASFPTKIPDQNKKRTPPF